MEGSYGASPALSATPAPASRPAQRLGHQSAGPRAASSPAPGGSDAGLGASARSRGPSPSPSAGAGASSGRPAVAPSPSPRGSAPGGRSSSPGYSRQSSLSPTAASRLKSQPALPQGRFLRSGKGKGGGNLRGFTPPPPGSRRSSSPQPRSEAAEDGRHLTPSKSRQHRAHGQAAVGPGGGRVARGTSPSPSPARARTRDRDRERDRDRDRARGGGG